MDVRQFAFLVRQPSAAVQSREHFCGLPKRGLALILASALFWQPLLVQADGIVVSGPGTSLGVAGNGVPIVDIAAPNGSGLSHNQFHDYNVGANGVILNNSIDRTQSTQLGGIILGNPNLNGHAASIILNEVNGGSPSQLRGYTEVAGQSAHVIVANPYGISCNGCGFINTPNVTLTTGKPILDNGRLDRYQVDGGAVSIDGQGLNASNVDRFEIITRSAKINAQINARELNVIAGRNDVNAKTLATTVRTDDGSAKPTLAIDSSALGGMYAGAIKLVGTEAGVGVKLYGPLAASGGDIQIDANGQLILAQAAASGAVNVKAASVDAQGTVYAGSALNVQTQGALNSQKNLVARDSITLSSGGQLTNNGIIEAGVNADNSRNATGDVKLSAQTLNNNGNNVIASRNLTVNVAQSLNNQGGTLSAKQSANIRAGTLDNQNKGRVLSSGNLDLNASQLLNAQGGLVNSSGPLTATVGQLNNRSGEVSSLGAATLNIATLDNVAGLVTANQALRITASGAINNQGGQLTSLDRLNLTAGAVDNSAAGRIASNQALTANLASLNNNAGKLTSVTALTLDVNKGQLSNQSGLIAAQSIDGRAASLDNSGGTLTSRGDTLLNIDGQLNNQNQGLINAANTLTLSSTGLNNQSGSLLGKAIAIDLGSATGDLNNNAGLISTEGPLTLKHLRDLSNQGGEISTAHTLNLSGRTLDNSAGKLISNSLLTLSGTSLINQAGLISGWQGVSLSGVDLDNRNQGTVSSRSGNVDARLSNSLLNSGAGALVSQKNLTVNTASLDNSDQGILSSGGGQTLAVSGLLNNARGGSIDSGAALDLQAQTLNNAGGTVSAQQALSLIGTRLDNSAGNLIGNGTVTLDLLGDLINSNGKLASAGDLLLKRASQINNQGGQLASQGLLSLFAGSLDNRHRGTIAANGALAIATTGSVQNSTDGLIYSQNADLTLNAASLDNAKGSLQSQTALNLGISGDLDNQSGKVIAQAGDVQINAATIDNRGGTLASLKGALQAKALGGWLRNDLDLNNNAQAGIIQAHSLQLTSASLNNNNGGRIAAQTGDTVVVTGAFDNRDGSLYAKSALKVSGTSFDNSGNLHGQVAGGQVDLSLSGALNNHKGIIESDTTLNVSAASVDNQAGQLRALGASGKTRFEIGGLLDNRDGTLETANNDLTLSFGGLQNIGGSVLHVGAGTFDVSTANLSNAGGSLVTRGDLTLAADHWTNSSVIQAGRLTVNVNTLNQAASGQLLATHSLIGTGSDWTTQGLIASDGSLDLTLGGLFAGTGRVSSQGDLNLSAAQVDLSDTASIASGGNITANISGSLNNRGRLTSASDLGLTAGSVNNYGTLGSGQQLSVSTGALLNEHALIFSGSHMRLRVDSLDNNYADIYSLGNLSIDRDGQGGLANRIINRSSTIQSDGNLSLAASTLQNIRAVLTTNDAGLYTARIGEVACIEGYNAGDCSGKKNHVWEIVQRDKLEVTEASAASSITSGGNLAINAGDLLNQSSTIAAAGDLSATATNLINSGIETGETETTRVFMSERTRNAGSWYNAANAFTHKYWFQSGGYTPDDLSGIQAAMAGFIGMTERELPQFRTTQILASDDQRYAAVIQAGGAVKVTAGNTIDSSVVRPGYTYVGSGARTDTNASGADFSTRITLNQQLPPDLAQQQINPLGLPGFSLPTGQNGLFRLNGQGAATDVGSVVSATPLEGQATSTGSLNINRAQGLPDNSYVSNPHKYLIETNPALTNLKQFMGSDYLLSNLGYDPDKSWKRLGDGLYEQRLIQQAVIARTGQRFLDNQTSDAGLYKYLMDNAIASQQPLNLAVGVSLTAAQVAALTHDIVWLENATVNGQQVLVPVLYLAQANNRLGPNGALIAGNDLNLIAGANLNNAGTLRATHNLSATAGANQVNSGLIEAGNRLDLLAGNNLTNKAGGIIAGRDVSLSAVSGDVLNERTVTHHQSSSGYRTERSDFVDNAARIEAANNLSVQAARDVSSIGGVMKSGADLAIKAGRDVNLIAAEQHNANAVTDRSRSDSTTQYGSIIEAGRDFQLVAGRDISAIASQIDAKRDIAMAATGDLTLASAANEQHSSFNSKKVKAQDDSVQQVSTTLTAGGDVSLSAGQDLALIASRVTAGSDVHLDAAQDLTIASAKDEKASFYQKQSKGSFGRSSSKQQESYDSTNVASVINAGRDLTVNTSKTADGGVSLNGGRNVSVVGSQLTAGNDLILGATNDVAVLSGVEEHGAYSKKTKSGFLGLSKSGKSQLNTSATQVGSELSAGNDVVIAAGNDVRLRASTVQAGNDSELRAGLVKDTGDINLVSANDTAYSHSEQYKKKTGLSVSGGFLSISSAKEAGRTAQSSTSVGSQVSADRDASLQAKQDINLIGSGISAGRTVSLDAGRDVNIVAAQNSNAEQDWKKNKQTGIGVSSDDNGVSFFAGADRQTEKNRREQQTAAASQISAGQDLAINAKRDINQTGSDLKAANDIDLSAGRNINIDAARERLLTEQQRESERNGLSATISHNYGNTKNAVSGAGKGEDGVSQASSTLKGVDAVGQFLGGPTGDVKFGNSKQSSSQQVVEQTNRPSTLNAGNDLNLSANNDVTVKGSQLGAGRDINIKGRDIALDVAKGSVSQESSESQSWGGIHGGTSGGVKLGVGGSYGVAGEKSSNGTSTVTTAQAGRDINLNASRDLNLVGTQASAGRDIELKAGNDLNIRAAQNDGASESNRNSGGGEVGLTFGNEGVGVYASVSMGKGNLEREGQRQQNAYLYAADRLGFDSGRDTNVAGADLRGDTVIGRVGGDLNVSSVADTGKVKGKEFDLSATVTIGPGAGVSGSVGYGQTSGKTDWVADQTRITASDKVDIRTEKHTQLDGALIASGTGNLKLDTGTLGFRDISGKDKEQGYYLNVGGTFKSGESTTQDPSQVGKGKTGQTGWSVSGWKYDKDREQSVRATVGAGEIIVRDAEDVNSPIAGLNRDVDKAYEITKDQEKRTELYVTDSSLSAVSAPIATFEQWKADAIKSGGKAEDLVFQMIDLLGAGSEILQGTNPDLVAGKMEGSAAMRQLGSRNEDERAAIVNRVLGKITNNANSPESQALADRITQIAGEDPQKALLVFSLLGGLNKPSDSTSSFLPAVPFAWAAIAALSGALVTAQPAVQENLRTAVNSVVEAGAKAGQTAKQNLQNTMLLWDVLFGTTLPIHLLDPSHRLLLNPILSNNDGHPSSGGFGDGSLVKPIPHTGGTQLDTRQDDGRYVTPEHRLDPGNMYSDGDGTKGISITIEPKIADQMGKRGWTESSIQSVIDKPVKTVVTKDTRFDTVSGSRLNDPATGYIAKDGSYVVRNDRTGAIVQVSNKKDPEWVAPWD